MPLGHAPIELPSTDAKRYWFAATHLMAFGQLPCSVRHDAKAGWAQSILVCASSFAFPVHSAARIIGSDGKLLTVDHGRVKYCWWNLLGVYSEYILHCFVDSTTTQVVGESEQWAWETIP